MIYGCLMGKQEVKGAKWRNVFFYFEEKWKLRT